MQCNTDYWNDDWDGLPINPHGTVHQIVLIRHGQYNTDGQGDENRNLTELGRDQAEKTGYTRDYYFDLILSL
jgi:hypothetical protein